MSTTMGILTIAKCFDDAAAYLGQRTLYWVAINPEQERWLWEYQLCRDSLSLVPTLKGWARPTAEELNQILHENKYDIRLNPWPPGLGFGVIAINDFTVQYLVEGVTEESWGHKITINDHPAFRLGSDAGFEFWESPIHRDPVIRIPTKEGDMIYMTKYRTKPVGFELLDAVRQIRDELRPSRMYAEGVVIPMVKLDQQPDISWLVGMNCRAELDNWVIAQALQQVKFGMNQFGARVREATAIAVMRGVHIPEYYYLNEKFLLWIERDGITVPLFMAHVTQEDWVDPGDLANL